MRLAIVFYNDHYRDSFTQLLLPLSQPLADWFSHLGQEDLDEKYADDDDESTTSGEQRKSSSRRIAPDEAVDGCDDVPFFARPRVLQRPDFEVTLVWADSKMWDYRKALHILSGGVPEKLHLKVDAITIVYTSYAYDLSYPEINTKSSTCWLEFASYIPRQHRSSLSNAWATMWNAFTVDTLHKRLVGHQQMHPSC